MDMFGFKALWSPYFMIFIVVIGLFFFLVTTVFRPYISQESEKLSLKQASLFLLVLILLYILLGSPIDLLGHIMFSVHMTVMAVLYLVIPPLFIISIPNWLWRKLFSLRFVKRCFRFLTMPLIALILFNGLFSFYHIPIIFDAVKTNMMGHAIYTIALFVAAICMWWPLVNRLEEEQDFSGLKRLGYVFANGVLLTPACALIIFANHPIYETYSNPVIWAQAMELCVPASTLSTLNLTGPEMFHTMPLLDDQKTGGIIMKIIQEIVYGIVLANIFYAWYNRENKESIDMNPKTHELL